MNTFRRLSLAVAAVGALAACGNDNPTEVTTLAGTYNATTFRVTPTGQSVIDVMAQGGSLRLVIASDNTTSGTLVIPASVAGGSAVTASMAGTVVRTGNSVDFQQSADTFVRDLTWTVNGNVLQVTDQAAGSARFTITLTR